MTIWTCRFGFVATLLAAILATKSAIHAAGPRVPGFERFYLASDSDAIRGGLLLLGELNCVACHAVENQAAILVKQAPRLDEVGSRVQPEFLRDFLANPQQTDVGTTMPHVLHASTDDERRGQVESLVHFLASTGQLSEAAPVTAGVNRGRQLFHSIGCVACHDPQQDQPSVLSTSVPLVKLSSKYSIPGLSKFLQNPLHVRPSGRMPQLNLTNEEARDIACYLLRDLKIPTSMTFQYYEGNWEKLPDFSQLPVKANGGASSFDVNVGAEDHFGVRFQGRFRVEKDGQYQFYLSSDDGSRLLIDGHEAIVNDGIHGMTEKNAKVSLTAGEHDFVAEYFEGGGEQELSIEYQGQGIKQQSLEFALVAPDTQSSRPRFVPNEKLAREGRDLFEVAGCAACHTMHVNGQRLTARRVGKKLTELTDGGCLAEQPQPGAPFFGLTSRQRESLSRALGALRSGHRPLDGAADRVAQTFTAFNCYACHDRGGVGGIEQSRNPHFQTNQPEMGDEGRLPPTLNGIGAKLRPDWLRQVFDKGAKDRPYMFTRMPRFGDANLGSLGEVLAELDRRDAHDLPENKLPTQGISDRRLKAIGRQLVGEKGMSCVKCHTWGNVQATGIQAISLTTMTRRLDRDWFRQYLLNPQIYRPGTRMPAAWPNGQTPFANILDGDALQQIRAVWTFLSDGNRGAMPVGIGPQSIELVADKDPIIYRNFIDGAGTRAIGVGYPERLNMAFDANNCRLALLWQGAFIDASMHWTGRGQGFQSPLGDNVLHLTDGVPLAVLESLDEPWPKQSAREQGITFSGYRLDAQRRPVFQYRWNGIPVEEAVVPIASKDSAHLQRLVQVRQRPPMSVWLRAAAANKIVESPDRWFVIDGDWRMRVTASGGKPMVRVSQGMHELLVPVAPSTDGGSSVIEIEFVW